MVIVTWKNWLRDIFVLSCEDQKQVWLRPLWTFHIKQILNLARRFLWLALYSTFHAPRDLIRAKCVREIIIPDSEATEEIMDKHSSIVRYLYDPSYMRYNDEPVLHTVQRWTRPTYGSTMNPSYIRYNDEPVLHTVQRWTRPTYGTTMNPWTRPTYGTTMNPSYIRYNDESVLHTVQKLTCPTYGALMKPSYIRYNDGPVLHTVQRLTRPNRVQQWTRPTYGTTMNPSYIRYNDGPVLHTVQR